MKLYDFFDARNAGQTLDPKDIWTTKDEWANATDHYGLIVGGGDFHQFIETGLVSELLVMHFYGLTFQSSDNHCSLVFPSSIVREALFKVMEDDTLCSSMLPLFRAKYDEQQMDFIMSYLADIVIFKHPREILKLGEGKLLAKCLSNWIDRQIFRYQSMEEVMPWLALACKVSDDFIKNALWGMENEGNRRELFDLTISSRVTAFLLNEMKEGLILSESSMGKVMTHLSHSFTQDLEKALSKRLSRDDIHKELTGAAKIWIEPEEGRRTSVLVPPIDGSSAALVWAASGANPNEIFPAYPHETVALLEKAKKIYNNQNFIESALSKNEAALFEKATAETAKPKRKRL